MYKQVIIARKDLAMSPGKLAAQVSHASMAFLTQQIRECGKKTLVNCSKHSSVEEYAGGRRLTSIDKIHKNYNSEDVELKPALYRRSDLSNWAKEAFNRGERVFYTKPKNLDDPYDIELCDPEYAYRALLYFDVGTFEEWVQGAFTKVICEAKNRNQLMKSAGIAETLGLKQGKDFFLIKDNCYTELEPEEIDEDGVGRTLTCIGFRPLPDDMAGQISKKYQLYH